MNQQLTKAKGRIRWIIRYALHQLLSPIGQFVISFFVIRFHSEATWGLVVNYLIVINLLAMFFNWGQSTYLIRAFSQNIENMAKDWQESLSTRFILLIISVLLVVSFFYNDGITLLGLLCWLCGLFWYSAFDPLHTYTRIWNGALVVEAFSILVISSLVIVNIKAINPTILIWLYTLQAYIKGMGYTMLYRKMVFKNWKWRFNPHFFYGAFPFFIPAMIGFVQSRVDLYGVAYYLPKETLGAYQIFFKLLMLLVLGSRVIISPFLKNIYRMGGDGLRRMNRLMMLIGILGTAPIIAAFYVLLPIVYGIEFSAFLYLIGYLMIVPFFGYVVLAHHLIKEHREQQLAGVFFIGTFINLFCNYLFIPTYGALGAIMSTAIVQWGLFLTFSLLVNRLMVK